MEQEPSIGRIVHYVTYGSAGGPHASEHCAAIVVGSSSGMRVDLFVIYPNGTSHKTVVPYSDSGAPGTWHWPERT